MIFLPKFINKNRSIYGQYSNISTLENSIGVLELLAEFIFFSHKQIYADWQPYENLEDYSLKNFEWSEKNIIGLPPKKWTIYI